MGQFSVSGNNPNQMVATISKWVIPARLAAFAPACKPGSAPSPDALPDLPGVQVAEGVYRVGGSVAGYCAILEKFRNGQQCTLGDIRSAIAANDWERSKRLAHTLKGLLGTLGAGRLKVRAAELEAAILDRANARIESLLPVVDTELSRLFVFIDRALQLRAARKGADDEIVAPAGTVNMDELTELICQAMVEMEQFDSGVEDTVSKIRRMVNGDAFMKKAIVSIEQHMRNYNYEQGLSELTACAKKLGIPHGK